MTLAFDMVTVRVEAVEMQKNDECAAVVGANDTIERLVIGTETDNNFVIFRHGVASVFGDGKPFRMTTIGQMTRASLAIKSTGNASDDAIVHRLRCVHNLLQCGISVD